MESYSKKSLVYVIIRNIFFIFALVALYQYVYKNFERQLHEQNDLREKYQSVYNDLEQFVKINENMHETKMQIEDIINSIPLDYAPNQDLLTGYRDRVIAVAEKYSVKDATETFVRDEASGMVTLTLNFRVKYEPLYKFLFDIEMFSKVHSFSIDTEGNIEVRSSPLLYSTSVDDYFSGRSENMEEVKSAGYFKEIFKKAADQINKTGHIPTWRDIDPAPKDPFYEYTPPQKNKTAVSLKRVVRRKPPPIDISGIIFDAVSPIVIIEGKIYKIGDFYKKNNIIVKIVAIQERTITVELDGQKYIIKFNKEG
ncbi:MAG: general secretion pathway protein GspB [Endomicrobium sp.]|jgi:hypothetical protein|nr:general secretion pathway protein GspB [Endomicrobium sp.]